MTNYAGIDYSMGRSNFDPKTRIRFGVISQNAIMPEATDDFEMDYGSPHCPTCGNEAVASDDETVVDAEWNDGKDYACAECEECFWSDSAFPDEAIGWSYDADGYKLADCLDNDIFVVESPYFTYAAFCSPCVPGACSLESPLDTDDVTDGILSDNKCFCLGPEWFDEYNPIPYTCYRVSDGTVVE